MYAKAGWMRSFGRALDQATKDIANAIWPNGGSADDQDQAEARDHSKESGKRNQPLGMAMDDEK